MSAFGTKRTSQCAQPMSAFGVKRTMTQVSENVRFWSSAFLAAHQTTAKIDTHDKIARVFLGRARRRKRPIWHLISIRGRKLELKRPHSRSSREGAFHPGARLHLCPGHAVGVARLQCDERLNRMALRATLQPLGRGCRAVSNSYSRCPQI